jgi:putative two-component system response regulator
VLLLGFSGSANEQLQEALASRHYDLTPAGSIAEALRLLQRERFGAIMLDVNGAHGGLDDLRRLCKSELALPTIVRTGANDAALAAACFRAGAADYLLDTAEPLTLDAALRGAIHRHEVRVREGQLRDALHQELARLTAKLRRARRDAAAVSMSALGSLVSMMEIRDRYLAGHSVRVAQLAASMAEELGRSAREVEQIRASGRLHDIGMLCVEDGILSKAGPLTAEEFERVKQHVLIADHILKEVPQLDHIRAFVRSHHERWDGTGYPDGLSGEAIPWASRLIGAAEIYDALTTTRPYKTSTTPEEAIERMETLRGSALAPEAFNALAAIVQSGRALVFIDSECNGGRLDIETSEGVEQW